MSNITSVTREECEMLLNFGWSWNDERIDRLIRAHITLRDSTEQTIAGMQLKLKQAVENTTDYMEAGMRAGFIFGVSKDKGATVDNDPKMACELMAIERDELRDDIEQTIKAADALAEALGPFAKTWDEFEFEGLDGLISAKDRISGELDCSLDIQIKHWRTAVAEGYCQAERTRNEPDISFPLLQCCVLGECGLADDVTLVSVVEKALDLSPTGRCALIVLGCSLIFRSSFGLRSCDFNGGKQLYAKCLKAY